METQHEEDLSGLSTSHLVRQALEEAKLLMRAEVLHAKAELKEEVRMAKASGILLGAAGVLALCAFSVLLVALALALPISEVGGLLIVGVLLLVIAGVLGFLGVKELPKKPLPKTQERLRQDVVVAREQLS